jgi:lysozyme
VRTTLRRMAAALTGALVVSLVAIPAHAPAQAAPTTFFIQRQAGVPMITPAGVGTAPRTESAAVRALVSKVSLAASAQKVAVGKPFTLTGTVSPKKAGVVVQRQRLLNGKWTTLGSARTNAKGVWTMNLTAPNSAQTIVYRAVAPKSKSTVTTSSRLTVAVVKTVAPPKTEATPTPTPTPTPTDTPEPTPTDATPTPTPTPTVVIDAKGLGGRILGTDISRWQHPNGQPIDFNKMYAAGARYVFIKASDGDAIEGSGLGHGNAAPWFATDRAAAQAAGILTGFYHFAQLPSSNDATVITRSARLQADLAISRLARVGGYGPMDLPYVFDLEVAPSGVNKTSITLFSRIWLEELYKRTGVRPIVYASPSYLQDKVNRDAFWRQYPLWIAHYMSDSAVLTRTPGSKVGGGCFFTPWTTTSCGLNWTFWQYTSDGPAQKYGIPSGQSRLDLNLFNGTSEQLMALTGKNTWVPAEADFLPDNEPTSITTSVTRLNLTQWTVTVRVNRVIGDLATEIPVISGTLSARLAAAAQPPAPAPQPTEPTDPNASPSPTTTPTAAPTPRIVTVTKIADGTWQVLVENLAIYPDGSGANTVTVTFVDNARIHLGNAGAAIILN